jgi:transcription antitermination factor NusG
MSIHPTLISAGGPVFISPDGKIPPDLWPDYAALVLLEPEPELLGTWIRKLEDGMGVTEAHRQALRAPPPKARADSEQRTASWYAIRTSTRQEGKALAALAERGFAVFMPCETMLRRIGRNYEVVNRPCFPGYLFTLCVDTDFAAVSSLDAVHAFVCSAEADGVPRPMPIPLSVIINLQAEERAGSYDRTRNKRPAYKPKKGEKVRITAGPWQAFMARVLDTPRGKRAQVMIEGPHGRGMAIDVKHLAAV